MKAFNAKVLIVIKITVTLVSLSFIEWYLLGIK